MEGHRLCIAALLTTFAINFELMTLEEGFYVWNWYLKLKLFLL